MYDIKPLEEEWKQYKKNKRKPFIIASGLILASVVGIFTFLNYKNLSFPKFAGNINKKKVLIQSSSTSSVLLDSSLEVMQTKVQPRKEVKATIVHVEHVKPKVIEYVEKSIEESIPTLPVVEKITVLEPKPKKIVIRQKPKKIKVHKSKIKKPRKKMHLNIIETSSVSAYKDVEKRFYQSHDIDDSLFLAKSYFRKGKFKKSEYWALQTNKINSNIEDSWIIFAKSKVKLGRKNEAILILSNYVKRSNSRLASSLLSKLKRK